jgi:vitamin B12 transporter
VSVIGLLSSGEAASVTLCGFQDRHKGFTINLIAPMKSILVSLFALLSVRPAFSQAQMDSTKMAVTGNPVIITATRSPQEVFRTGRSVDVVSFQGGSPSVLQPIGLQLSRLPGFYVAGALQHPGGLQSATVRGSAAVHNTVLLDGLRIVDPTSPDQALDLSELSAVGLERMETVRGAHSTLYGSQAVGGVVNLVSEKPRPGFSGRVGLSSGTFGSGTGMGGAAFSLQQGLKNGFFWQLSGLGNELRGFNATVDTLAAGAFRHNNQGDGFRKSDAQFRGGYETENVTAIITARSHWQRSDLDDGAFRDDDNHTSEVRRSLAGLHVGAKAAENVRIDWRSSIQVFERSVEDLPSEVSAGVSDATLVLANNDGRALTSDVQAVWVEPGMRTVGGITWQQDRMNSETFFRNDAWDFESSSSLKDVNPEASLTGLFLRSEWEGARFSEVLSGLQLGGGVRFNHHSLFGNVFTWDVNPVWRLNENLLVYGNAASGFNAPSLYRMFANEADFTSGIVRGNRALRPEFARSLETGVKMRTDAGDGFSVALFQNTVKDVIEYVYLWNPAPAVSALSFADYRGDTYLNAGTQRNRGVEITAQSRVWNGFSAGGNVSLVQSELEVDAAAARAAKVNGQRVQLFNGGAFLASETVRVPQIRRPVTANGFVSWTGRLSNARIEVQHIGARKDAVYAPLAGPFGALGTAQLDAVTLINFSAGHRVGKNLVLELRADNVLNTVFSDVRGYAGRPRMVLAQVGVMF